MFTWFSLHPVVTADEIFSLYLIYFLHSLQYAIVISIIGIGTTKIISNKTQLNCRCLKKSYQKPEAH